MEVSGRIKLNRKNIDGHIYCQPCQGEGDNVQADGFCETCNEYLCSSCLRVHRKLSATKNHEIKGKDEMPRFKVQTDPCSELCEVHKSEVVKFFCKGHNSVGCSDCMVLEHKSCKIQLVSDISGNYGNKYELKEIKQKIEELEKKISASKVEIKKSIKASDDVKAEVIKDIKTFRREMEIYLEKVEAELIEEVEQINVKDVSQQRQLFDECVTMENELQEYRTKLDQYSDKINQLFVTAKLAQTKLNLCQNKSEKIASESQIHVYKFEPCKDVSIIKMKSTPIGEISTQIQKFIVKSKINIVDMKTQYVREINVKATHESEKCWITGLARLSPDEILLADYNNMSLKILNVKSNAITSILKFSFGPWDVTVINSETVATTLPKEAKIVFLNTRNGLSESHSLKVRKCCRGIDHRNGVLAVSYDSGPPGVQILNMKGDVLHDVKETNIFSLPLYIAFRDDTNIFVSDRSNHAVYKLTKDGHLKATMKGKEIRCPRGLAMTSNGTVVVCCKGNSDSVSMIEPGTRDIKQLSVQHVKDPYTILVCEEDSMVYISESRATANDNFIKVYNLM